MVSRSSRDRRSEASDAPDKVEGFHLDWMFTKHDLGIDISYGREFSLCERAGSKVDNDTKNFSDILKVLKTLRDMHRSLVKAIAIESGGALSKQVLNACISRFKRIMERAEKEKFIPGKVTIIEAKESRTPKKPKKPKSEELYRNMSNQDEVVTKPWLSCEQSEKS
ncbi:hypothetical protein RhiirC2_736253 [Rhizophagus irregularis]|uniref:Uncharacterized protein n=1 Tax=Rhizophagus irregularis TaxID=588596 RepID=A0A2N1NNZ8_9GLOM|nr:hypothetical protein RhiirC2_736253 [Rhizophagus irregularis]